MKVGIWGYYGFDNLGDDLILDVLIDWLLEIGNRIEPYTFIKKESSEEVLQKHNISNQENRSVRNALKFALLEADAFVIGGGGIFPAWTYTRLLFYNAIALIMKARQKPCVCIGVGVEEKNLVKKVNRIFLSALVSNASVFTIRELALRNDQAIKPLKCEKEIIPTADIVFSHKTVPTQKQRNRFNIFLADVFDIFRDLDQEKFNAEIAKIINGIIAKGYEVYLIPFTNKKDQRFNEQILKSVHSSHCHSVTYSKNIDEMMEEIGKARFALCMRFHGIVTSALYNIPVCSISYGDKSTKLMERLGIKDFDIPFGDNTGTEAKRIELSAENIMAHVDEMIASERTLKEQLEISVSKMKKESAENYAVLKNTLKEFGT